MRSWGPEPPQQVASVSPWTTAVLSASGLLGSDEVMWKEYFKISKPLPQAFCSSCELVV